MLYRLCMDAKEQHIVCTSGRLHTPVSYVYTDCW